MTPFEAVYGRPPLPLFHYETSTTAERVETALEALDRTLRFKHHFIEAPHEAAFRPALNETVV
jgi:hypothetical protein